MKKYLYITLLIISGCGFNPIYINQNMGELEYKKIILDGDKVLNDKLVQSINLVNNELNEALNEIIIKSGYSVNETSKNTKGEVESYTSNLEINIEIQNDKKVVKSKKFVKNFTYMALDNRFELVKYQEQIKNNLLNEVASEIFLFLNFNDS